MRFRRTISILSILFMSACVDRLDFDIELPLGIPITIDGSITNQPGPYRIEITSGFDIKSESQMRQPLTVKRVVLMDDLGIVEELTEAKKGTYLTSATGMQGRVGGVYKIRVELFDGKVYESLPDTILSPGTIESFTHEFNIKTNATGANEYGFDLKVNSFGGNRAGGYYRWKMKGTFKANTKPELTNTAKSQCYPFNVNGSSRCNFIPPCSGLQNISLPREVPPRFVRIGPCQCCTCWYDLYNRLPILNNNQLPTDSTFRNVELGRIPLNAWIFMFKIYVEARQESISATAYRFFDSIRDQQEAVGNIFQPIIGKIPNNFIQLEGEPTPVNGLFYAAGVDTKTMLITRDDVPNKNLIPEVVYEAGGMGAISCMELFPNATTTKPDFWED